MMDREEGIMLQVLVSAYGGDGINRLAAGMHPHVEGVRYLVSWQASEGVEVPAALEREDFRIYRTDTVGLSKNRNNSLALATAPLLLISDDDVDYTREGLETVIRSFADNPLADIILFEYESESGAKKYPSQSFPLENPPKGYFVSSIEIAFRRSSVWGKCWFNESFGVGARFPSGEEEVFIRDCMDAGLKGIFLPAVIARHDSPTTSGRNLMSSSRPYAKGAVFTRLHHSDWPLRMLVHSLREIPLWLRHQVPSPWSYCVDWMRGAIHAEKGDIFPTPDYFSKYPTHEK